MQLSIKNKLSINLEKKSAFLVDTFCTSKYACVEAAHPALFFQKSVLKFQPHF